MNKKLTYERLEQKVIELEEVLLQLNRTDSELKKCGDLNGNIIILLISNERENLNWFFYYLLHRLGNITLIKNMRI